MKLYFNEGQASWLREGLVLLGTTVLSLLLAMFIISDFTTLEVFAPAEKKVDFKISDIYNAVDENRAVKPLSQDVVVLNTDAFDRSGLVQLLPQVAAYEPKAIGLDYYFAIETTEEANDSLHQAILGTPNLVCITGIEKKGEGYQRKKLSFFEKDPDYAPNDIGYAYLVAKNSWNVVRMFVPRVTLDNGEILPSMSLRVAQIACPQKAEELLARGNFAEIIDYTSYEIDTIDATQLNNPGVGDRLRGKVVMIGGLHDNKDTYLTPLHEPKAGVMIHAYTVQTILSGRYIRTSAAWLDWLIAIVLCITFLSLLLTAKKRMSYIGNLLIRISQFAIMYGLVWLGCYIYAGWHTYMNFTPAILMLGFGAVAFDISFALYGIIRNSIHTIQKLIHKR